jgi:hypothetical protein
MTNIISTAIVVMSSVAAMLLHTQQTTYDLPNARLTPGAIADTDVRVICDKDYDKTHRPDAATSHSLKTQTMSMYGLPSSQIHTVEADALIPVGIGGNHFVVANIWPQSCTEWKGYRCVAGAAYVKDIKEDKARRNVCSLLRTDPDAAQQLLLQYQHQFATDWRKVS